MAVHSVHEYNHIYMCLNCHMDFYCKWLLASIHGVFSTMGWILQKKKSTNKRQGCFSRIPLSDAHLMLFLGVLQSSIWGFNLGYTERWKKKVYSFVERNPFHLWKLQDRSH